MANEIRNFKEYLSCNNIICNIQENDGQLVLKNLLDMLNRHFPELDIEEATTEVKKREELFPTVIAPGLAIPHARLEHLKYPLVAMACSPDGVSFGINGDTVNVMILLLTPLDEPNLHMQLMAALAMDFSAPDAINQVAKLPTPMEVINYFSGNEVVIPEYLTARDVMRESITTLNETDSLMEAINLFSTKNRDEIPVIDKDGDLRGVVSLFDLLKYCLPEHLLWMEDLSSIYRLQPFSDMLKASEDTKIADVMREEFISVNQKVPAIQLAKLFIVNEAQKIIIVDDANKLVGVVELKEFCSKFFWE